ncbi:MAG TPA: zinc ribbon domain-containing protein [Pyrinomonadaceae bacterium]|jgi:hypothetical protein
MYCPKCGTENIEGANFCRGCGADLAPISQALSGHAPEKRSAAQSPEVRSYEDYKRRKYVGKEPRLDKAITNIFTGIGFILVAAMVFRFAPAGKIWWFWMLIPAFTTLGGGVAEYVRYKHWKGEEPELPGGSSEPQAAAVPPARVSALPPRNTSEMVPPPSVTEGTTRHLNIKAEAPPRDT